MIGKALAYAGSPKERSFSIPSYPAVGMSTEPCCQPLQTTACSVHLYFKEEKLCWYKQLVSKLWTLSGLCHPGWGCRSAWCFQHMVTCDSSEGNSQVKSVWEFIALHVYIRSFHWCSHNKCSTVGETGPNPQFKFTPYPSFHDLHYGCKPMGTITFAPGFICWVLLHCSELSVSNIKSDDACV